jgi:hypothetical protein
MPLARLHAPFDHPDWIFELKYDGWRALAYIEAGQVQADIPQAECVQKIPDPPHRHRRNYTLYSRPRWRDRVLGFRWQAARFTN